MTYSAKLYTNVFNPQKLTRQMKLSQSRTIAIIEIVDTLISNGIRPIIDAQKAFLRGQPHQSIHMLHSIKGSIGNIGGLKVVELSETLEEILDHSASAEQTVVKLFKRLENEYRSCLTEADIWLKNQRSQLMSKSALQAAKNQAQINQFKHLLKNYNLKACDAYQDLQELLKTTLSEKDFEGLDNHIHNLDFKKALECVHTI